MAIKNQDIFGKTVQNHWKALEQQEIIEQKARDTKYAVLKGNDQAAKAVEEEITKEALARSESLFAHFKNYEAQMQAQLVAAGRKDDPYRASLPDNYKDPSTPATPEKEIEKPVPNKEPEKVPQTTVAGAEGNPNNRFGYVGTKEQSTTIQVFEKPIQYGEAPQVPSQVPQTTVVGVEGNPNNRFGYEANKENASAFKNASTYTNTNYSFSQYGK